MTLQALLVVPFSCAQRLRAHGKGKVRNVTVSVGLEYGTVTVRYGYSTVRYGYSKVRYGYSKVRLQYGTVRLQYGTVQLIDGHAHARDRS